MKSLLNEALARHQEAQEQEEKEKAAAAAKPETAKTTDDADIEKIVESINVSIKIVGCGGGGSNTIDRCSEAGISGAQLCAVNTDAKHLLSVHAPKKILIGKRLTKGLGAGALPEVGEQAARREPVRHHHVRGAQPVPASDGDEPGVPGPAADDGHPPSTIGLGTCLRATGGGLHRLHAAVAQGGGTPRIPAAVHGDGGSRRPDHRGHPRRRRRRIVSPDAPQPQPFGASGDGRVDRGLAGAGKP